jgi:hypothetical protein
MSSKKKESKASEKEKIEKKKKSSKEGEHSSEDDDFQPNRSKSAAEVSHGELNPSLPVRKVNISLKLERTIFLWWLFFKFQLKLFSEWEFF